MSRYENPELWESHTEFVFKFLIIICRKLNMNFVGFRAVVGIIQLSLIAATVKKYAQYPALVMLIYFICPFPLCVAQMRSALAASVMIFGFRFLIEKSERVVWKFELNDIKYILCILIACMIHTSSIIWIVLLLAKKLKRKSVIVFMVVFNLLVYFVVNPNTLAKVASLFGAGARISAYLSLEYQSSEWRHIGPIVNVVVIFIIIIVSCVYIQRSKAKRKILPEEKKIQTELCVKVNIVLLCILGIILRYTSEVTRMQDGVAILNYMVLTNCLEHKKFRFRRLSKSNLVILGLLGLYVGFYLWYTILRYLEDTVWSPFWFNNYLFSL